MVWQDSNFPYFDLCLTWQSWKFLKENYEKNQLDHWYSKISSKIISKLVTLNLLTKNNVELRIFELVTLPVLNHKKCALKEHYVEHRNKTKKAPFAQFSSSLCFGYLSCYNTCIYNFVLFTIHFFKPPYR